MSKDILISDNQIMHVARLTRTIIKSKTNLSDAQIIDVCRETSKNINEQSKRVNNQGFRKILGGLGLFIDGLGDVYEDEVFDSMKRVE